MIIIGIDPDSSKSGVAIYIDGNLHTLESMSLITVYKILNSYKDSKLELHIEDVNGIKCSSFNWIKSGKPKPVLDKINAKISESVGKCKQAQVEVERIAENFNIKIVKHRVSSKWKTANAGKAEFEKVTGWTGRSNEDTRSAAYFGYVGTKQ